MYQSILEEMTLARNVAWGRAIFSIVIRLLVDMSAVMATIHLVTALDMPLWIYKELMVVVYGKVGFSKLILQRML